MGVASLGLVPVWMAVELGHSAILPVRPDLFTCD